MKYFTLLLFLISSIAFSTTEKGTPTKIKAVTVYLNGAQIERTASIKLPAGTTAFTFEKLSPNIQESSIQVSGLKNASILSINFGINYLNKHDRSEDIKNIHTQIQTLYDAVQAEDHFIAGFSEELYLITQNRALGNSNQVVSLEKLQTFAAYYRKRTSEIKAKIYASQKVKGEINAQISELKQQLNELSVDEKIQTGEIKIKLNTEITTDLELQLSYNVTDAGWFPIYDIKAEKINTPIQLIYKAHIYQSTGNDWDNIKLTLSTNDPNTNNIKPNINPKYLNFISSNSAYRSNRATKRYNYKYNPLVKTVSGVVTSNHDGLPLPGVNVIEKGTSNGTQTDFDGRYSLTVKGQKALVYSFLGMQTETLPIHSSIMNVVMNPDLSSLEEVVVVAYGTEKSKTASSGYVNRVQQMIKDDSDEIPYIEPVDYTSNGDIIEEGITNTRFEIKKSYTIPTNGDVTVIEIENYDVPATYAYFAAPVLNENVFLTAKIKNWEQYNLLPAEANVYFEGSYSGKTNINPQSTTEQLTISLGVDPNVIVKREQPKDYKKNAFIGNNKIISKRYDIEIKNNKSVAIDLILYDRIPISQHKDIKIDDIETGTSEYDDKKGILKWNVNLEAKAKDTFTFSYVVKYPKYKRVNL
ncbi:mucoidy inhibitor MuiA family protein [Psychroserpens sp. SPM9]|uniref:mucoidy inhibitor MuiA family protein n=1 Tax=Psychroserpens sp. SPM9 TaxID=2975598 RepID=UPI0021A426E8|nr:mucoidy inhibitor MuiA family protein [Psychroserpens sp. SPM9]MDG5491961.1 mucoidy inhibitor MuiA family protein [Psychroserpens sp. SPM9]